MNRARSMRGVTLVELIVFIVILGIAATGIMVMLSAQVGNAAPGQILEGTKLAEGRLDLLLGQRQAVGFTALADPCTAPSPPAACSLPSGYRIAQPTVITNFNQDPALTELQVKVTGPDGRVDAVVTDVVAEY